MRRRPSLAFTFTIGGRLAKEDYVVSVNLTIDVEDELGSAPSLGYSEPLAVADTSFNATLGGDFSRGRTRKFTTTYTLDSQRLAAWPKDVCNWTPSSKMGLRGNLGIAEIVRDGLVAKDRSLDAAVATPDEDTGPSFGSTVEFVVTQSGKAGFGWKLSRYEGFGGDGSLFRTQRATTDTLVLGFAPNYGDKTASSPRTEALEETATEMRLQANAAQADKSATISRFESLQKSQKSGSSIADFLNVQSQVSAAEARAKVLEDLAVQAEADAEKARAEDAQTARKRAAGKRSREVVSTQILQNIRIN